MKASFLICRRFAALVLMGATWGAEPVWAQPDPPERNTAAIRRERAVSSVREALAQHSKGQFGPARASLEGALNECGGGPDGLDCRTIVASGLGSLLQRQAAADRPNAEALTREAVGYYDRALREDPNQRDALYGKALAYRALGPQEGQESFFAEAVGRDSSRLAVYSSFQGDYYASIRRWPAAVAAYRRALEADPDDDGARGGLVEALSALGPSTATDLLRHGREWSLRYPGSAASAYGAALVSAFGSGTRVDNIADQAYLGLVSAQTRTGRTPWTLPPGVPGDWSPPQELRAFMDNPIPATVPWWSSTIDRRRVLARAALSQGRQALSDGKLEAAERVWQGAATAVEPTSSASLDLQRELAVLYFQQPALDPDGHKFDKLEHDIFAGKMGALAAGDLEAAQRYHTTLGLIYAERGVWRSDQYARNAERQLAWALDKAEERERMEGFYQPLAELRLLLAQGLGPLGKRQYAAAMNAFLDTDELAAANSAAESAGIQSEVLIMRSRLARGGPGAASACVPEGLARLGALEDRGFATRQRFKILADCAALRTAGNPRVHAIDAFRLVETSQMTLVGMADVARLERVVTMIRGPEEPAYHAGHLDVTPTRGELSIRVALPGETRMLWLSVKPALRERLRRP
jgi:tetratricopeptide (TPR) repeat protein